MAHSKNAVYRTVETIYNLTKETYNVYTSGGGLKILPPDNVLIFPKTSSEVYYITDEETYKAVKKNGLDTQDLVRAETDGIGRGGVELTKLFLYDNPAIHIYPAGE